MNSELTKTPESKKNKLVSESEEEIPKEKKRTYKEIDYLDEDEPIVGQKWACISFLSPEGIKNCKIRGIKIRGVYSSREEADTQAERLTKVDPDFHIFVGEVGKWLPQDPDPESAQDEVYQEKELQALMKEYKQNREKAKQFEAERKQKMLREAIQEEKNKKEGKEKKHRKKGNPTHLRTKNRNELARERAQEKMKEKNTENRIKDLAAQQIEVDTEDRPEKQTTSDQVLEKDKEVIDQQIEEIKEEQQELKTQKTQVREKTYELEDMKGKLNKIRQLWDNIQKKSENIQSTLEKNQ